jgi:DNA-binding MarR family transcriptional regulator
MATATRTDVAEFIDALDSYWRAQRRAQGRFNNHLAAVDISLPQYHLLEPLALAGETQPVSRLAEAAGVSTPSATRMLSGLEGRGLVDRVPDAHDRRMVRVALTARGRELVLRKRAMILDARTTIFDALPASERAVAAGLLNSLAAAIDELHP